MKNILEQLKIRRLALGLKQKDMKLRIGMSRKQYQHLESRGNPRLETLTLLATGLKSELILVPNDKLSLIKKVLEDDTLSLDTLKQIANKKSEKGQLANDPWKNLLGDEE
ncbi:MAG: transcriptional regulator [Robiginitomaculum sp.]|nr:MAG: transcriptional regulator [Robiginitomaculum sp.]